MHHASFLPRIDLGCDHVQVAISGSALISPNNLNLVSNASQLSHLELECHTDSTPKYVVASHRWNAGTEATLKDVRKRRNTASIGYQKVEAFAKYIRSNIPGVEWLWIDTVCIDQRSSQEVSEAINSMFRLYSGAELCLAYLSDVDRLGDFDAFLCSSWFRRGWTLQELLAPRQVVFLTRDWQVLGNKGELQDQDHAQADIGLSLEATVSKITKIPASILKSYGQNMPISMDECRAWMAERETTRDEDMWYCLCGIFGVAMGANYGEGPANAERRLLQAIADASGQSSTRYNTAISMSSIAPTLPAPASSSTSNASRKLSEKLHFAGMHDRRHQIDISYNDTYRWILEPKSPLQTRQDNLLAWLSDVAPPSRTYWIEAKPGAGKSSLMRFLDSNISSALHLQPWAYGRILIRAHHYFWSPGTAMQKSVSGLLRTLLLDIVTRDSNLSQHFLLHMWTESSAASKHWTDSELRRCLMNIASSTADSHRFLVLIDGLDEISGGNDARETLVDLITELAAFPHFKLLVSSRRWPEFQEAFFSCPRTRLEDANRNDIASFVMGQFRGHQRYQRMLSYHPGGDRLESKIIDRAEGVFLWAKLVVKELKRGLTNGDSLQDLQDKLNNIPDDLDQYFDRLMASIEPEHRREASLMLQIAMYEEEHFASLQDVRLMDMMFTNDLNRSFGVGDVAAQYAGVLQNHAALFDKLDSTLRKLYSRCKGILECYHTEGEGAEYSEEESGNEEEMRPTSHITLQGELTGSALVSSLSDSFEKLLRRRPTAAFHLTIDFMHRSIRDYLMEPKAAAFLDGCVGESFHPRNYLRNARLVQLLFAKITGSGAPDCVGTASYLISTLSIPSFRNQPSCIAYTRQLGQVIDFVESGYVGTMSYWYIGPSLGTWTEEQSNITTLAIDFALTSYLAQALTKEAVKSKKGRPLLDYATRPRFGHWEVEIGNMYPLPEVVNKILSLGADPNEHYGGVSIWALFLNFVASTISFLGEREIAATNICLGLFIKAGANTALTKAELSAPITDGPLDDTFYGVGGHVSAAPFSKRWPGLALFDREVYSLLDVLESLRTILGPDVDSLKMLVRQVIGHGAVAEIERVSPPDIELYEGT